MKPEPNRTFTLAPRLFALTLVVIICGCGPAAFAASEFPEFPGEPAARPAAFSIEVVDTEPVDDAETAEAPDEPVPQSAEAQAAAYKETLDAALRFQAADMAKMPHRHGRAYRSRRSGDFPIGRVAVAVIVGIVLLRVVVAGRKPATPSPAPTRTLAPPPVSRSLSVASRQIISLACGRCDRVLDLPRDRAARRLFCPRCGAVMPSEA